MGPVGRGVRVTESVTTQPWPSLRVIAQGDSEGPHSLLYRKAKGQLNHGGCKPTQLITEVAPLGELLAVLEL